MIKYVSAHLFRITLQALLYTEIGSFSVWIMGLVCLMTLQKNTLAKDDCLRHPHRGWNEQTCGTVALTIVCLIFFHTYDII